MTDWMAPLLAAVPIAGGVGIWVLRLEGRVNGHDQKFDAITKLNDERHADLKEDLKDIKQALKISPRS